MRICLSLAVIILLPGYACAQWDFSAGVSGNDLRNIERNAQAQQIVKEQGWLPGLQLSAAYRYGNWRAEFATEWENGQLDYDGQQQNGVAQTSQTATRLQRQHVLLAYQVWHDSEILIGAEHDGWQRDIEGVAKVAGLQENYTSQRWLAGFNTPTLPLQNHVLQAQVLWVKSAAENIHVSFGQQLFDPVQLQTSSANGWRFALNYQVKTLPNWRLNLNWENLNIPASSSYPLYKNHTLAGTVSEPAHSRTRTGLRLDYLF